MLCRGWYFKKKTVSVQKVNIQVSYIIYFKQLQIKRIQNIYKKDVYSDYGFLAARNLKKFIQLSGGVILYSQVRVFPGDFIWTLTNFLLYNLTEILLQWHRQFVVGVKHLCVSGSPVIPLGRNCLFFIWIRKN